MMTLVSPTIVWISTRHHFGYHCMSTLNTWITPDILSVPLVDFKSFDTTTDPVLQHIKHFSGGDPVMADYITKTLALKVQKPGMKTLTAILAVSKEGAGIRPSSSCACMASAFWGAQQVLNTTKLEDLCGSFSLLANKIIVVYDEPKSKDTHESAEQLKFLITTTQTEIGAKGIQKTKQQTPGLLFLCSNNVGGKPIQTNEGDRRWVITRCNVPPCTCAGECRKTCRVKRGTGGCIRHTLTHCMTSGCPMGNLRWSRTLHQLLIYAALVRVSSPNGSQRL